MTKINFLKFFISITIVIVSIFGYMQGAVYAVDSITVSAGEARRIKDNGYNPGNIYKYRNHIINQIYVSEGGVVKETNYYCMNSKVELGENINFTGGYNMASEEGIGLINGLSNSIYKDTISQNYTQIMWILDHMYVEKNSTITLEQLLNDAGIVYAEDDEIDGVYCWQARDAKWQIGDNWKYCYRSGGTVVDYILNQEEIEAIQQIALWYFTKNVNSAAQTESFTDAYTDLDEYDETNADFIGSWFAFTDDTSDSIRLLKKHQAAILLNYFVDEANKAAQNGYIPSGGSSSTDSTNMEIVYANNGKIVEEGTNYKIGPIKLNNVGEVEGIQLNVKTGSTYGTTVNSSNVTLKNTSGSTITVVPKTQNFYVVVPKSSISDRKIRIEVKGDKIATTKKLWIYQNGIAQPIVEVTKESVEVSAKLDDTIEENPFDLALRKEIVAINNKTTAEFLKNEEGRSATRKIHIDKTTIPNTATYNHRKDPIVVKTNDIVTYRINIYNEGKVDGYAKKIVDQLPEGLTLYNNLSDSSNVTSNKGNVYHITYDGTNRKITLELTGKNYALKAYSGNLPDSDYIQISCNVTQTSDLDGSTKHYLTNIAYIAEEEDKDGNDITRDRNNTESTPNNTNVTNGGKNLNVTKPEDIYKGNASTSKSIFDNTDNTTDYFPGQEDDDDFETVVVLPKIFDLALRKEIVAVEGQRTAEFIKNENGAGALRNISINKSTIPVTATYNHRKDPVVVEENDNVTYRINIYNEGEVAGYASKIIDKLPKELEGSNGTITSNKGNTYSAEYNSSTNTVTLTLTSTNPTAIAAYQTNVDSDYIEITCKVKQKAATNGKTKHYLTNIAYIAEAKDSSKTPVPSDRGGSESSTNNTNTSNGTNGLNVTDVQNAYKGKNTNGSISSGTSTYYEGQEDDDDFETVVVLPKIFDLKLMKFISKINGVQTDRAISINKNNLRPNGTKKSTADYDVYKNPLKVETGDLVTYTLRIYNEGEISGYATEITEDIPAGLEFLTTGSTDEERAAISFNNQRGWTKVTGSTNKIKTNYLANKLIDAYDGTNLDHEDVQVILKVTGTDTTKTIRNEAAITDDADVDGKEVDDIDSYTDRWNKTPDTDYYKDDTHYPKYVEDDEDYDNIQIVKFDLALRKFITKVSKGGRFNDTSVTTSYSRAPVVDTSKIGTTGTNGKVITTATYKHSKEPILLDIGDYVEYTLRVYNEGDKPGYAKEITDYLPVYLDFADSTDTYISSINSNWTYDSTTRKVTTKSTAPVASRKLEAFEENDTELDHFDTKIICVVNSNAMETKKITNIAEISKYADEIGEREKDIDSTRDNLDYPVDESTYKDNENSEYIPGQEDDDDFEKVQIRKNGKYDLILVKQDENGEDLNSVATFEVNGAEKRVTGRLTVADDVEINRSNFSNVDTYVIKETVPPDEYCEFGGIITVKVTKGISTDGKKYEVKSIDYTVKDSEGNDIKSLNDADVTLNADGNIYVKVKDYKEPEIHKGVKTVENQDSGYNSEEEHQWVIKSDIPTDIAKYKEYIITDSVDKRLDFIANSIEVKVGETVLNRETDYKFKMVSGVEANGEGIGIKFTIIFIDDTINVSDKLKANPGKKIEVKFKTKFAKDRNGKLLVNLGDEIENQADLDYTNGSGVSGNKESEKPEVHTGGVTLFKYYTTKRGDIGLEGAEFKIYASREDAVNDENEILTSESDANGIVKFIGLEYGEDANNSEDNKTELGTYEYDSSKVGTKYWVKETVVPEGFEAESEEPIEVIVNKTSYEEEATEIHYKVKNNKIIKFDLSLRKFITAISKDGNFRNAEKTIKFEGEDSRKPDVDVSKLGTLDENGNPITTAIYNHTKEPIKLDVGDYVEYTIRVYNEGNVPGYAKEITDYLPEYLDFADSTDTYISSINSNWEYDSTTRKVRTKSTAPVASRELEAFEENDTELDHFDTKIICIVNSKATTAKKITNIAEISKYADEDGEREKDIDSTKDDLDYPEDESTYKDEEIERKDEYIPGQEDDDDFEKVEIYEGPEIHKGVKTVENQDSGYDKEEEQEWVIKSDIPEDIGTYKEYIVKDGIDYRLTFRGKSSVEVKVGETKLKEGEDYILEYTGNTKGVEEKTTSGEIKITFVGKEQEVSKILKDNTGKKIEIRFKTKFAKDMNGNLIVKMGEKVENEATLEYTNKTGATGEKKTERPEVHTGGVTLYKYYAKGEEKEGLEGAEFEIYRSKEDAEKRENAVGTAISDKEGIVRFEGLEYGEDAEGKEGNKTERGTYEYDETKVSTKYWVVETKAPANYEIKEEMIEVEINKDSYVEEVKEIKYEVENRKKKFDLALRKFITEISGEEVKTRIPEVEYEGGKITYKHPKDVLKVGVGDIVVYTIRVYNEGEIAGYAKEITDDIPEYLEYIPNNEVNKEYKWKMYDKEGKETDKKENAEKIVTEYAGDTLLKRFDGSKEISEMNPEYVDVKVAFKVKDPKSTKYVITNKAQISEDADEDGNPVEDIDSKPDEWNEGEDDQDYENVSVEYFDLALLKYVSKVMVTENGKTRTTNTGNTGGEKDIIPKVEIHKKRVKTTMVKYEYIIKITNEGDVEGYAKEITDYVPNGLKFYAEDNTGWKDEGNNVISTRLLENKLLKPGESATVKVILRWINGENNLGTKVNVAEISEDDNEKHIPDRDSTPDNKKEGEDDIDDAAVVLSIRTGLTENIMLYVGGGLIALVVLAGGIVLIKKFVL